MKIYVLILPIILLPFLSESGLAQTKKETVEWLNSEGEEYLREITGNTSVYWEIEDNGTLKVTNHKVDHTGAKRVIRRYTYLNLYELDSEGPLITGKGQPKELALRCKSRAGDCIKTRYYYTNTSFKTDASSSLLFSLERRFNKERGKELEKKLLLLIQLINGKETG